MSRFLRIKINILYDFPMKIAHPIKRQIFTACLLQKIHILQRYMTSYVVLLLKYVLHLIKLISAKQHRLLQYWLYGELLYKEALTVVDSRVAITCIDGLQCIFTCQVIWPHWTVMVPIFFENPMLQNITEYLIHIGYIHTVQLFL